MRILAADIAEFRAAQAAIGSLALADVRDFWDLLDLGRPEAARNALLEVVPAVTTQWGEVSAAQAAEWYGDMRSTVGVTGSFRPVMGATAAVEWVQRQVRFGAQHLFTNNPAQMLLFLEGPVIRYTLEGGRNTIIESVAADPQAVGWQRIARPDACKFCRFLMSNGAVYKTADTGSFAAHQDCKCVAVQSWDADAPEVPARVYEASKRTSGMSQAQRERHRANIRGYLEVMD